MTQPTTTQDRLLNLIRTLGYDQNDTATAQSRLREDLGFDSLDAFDLACDVLEEFDVNLDDHDLMGMQTVGDFVKLIDDELAMKHARAT